MYFRKTLTGKTHQNNRGKNFEGIETPRIVKGKRITENIIIISAVR